MHHPDISNIVQILDDYFLISFPNTSSSVKGKKTDEDSEDSLVVYRELTNGRLEIEIRGECEDDNDVDIVYYKKVSDRDFDKRLEICCCDFELQTVRKAIRDIVLYDINVNNSSSNKKSVETWLKD